MVLKRKRSDDAMSLCSNSPPHFASSASPSPDTRMDHQGHTISSHYIPEGVSSRTLKRWRNSRPDDQAVYDYTLSKLYTAQQQLPSPSSPTFTPINLPSSTMSLLSSPRKSFSSHTHQNNTPSGIFNFFTRKPSIIPHPFSTNPLHNTPTTRSIHTITCSDCDVVLQTPFDDEDGECYGCVGCSKKVCGGCSIGGEEVGMVRRCLECCLH